MGRKVSTRKKCNSKKKNVEKKVKPRRLCCNPFGSHINWKTDNLQSITKELAAKVQMNLIVGDYICDLCRRTIREKRAQSASECSSKLDEDRGTTPECRSKSKGKRVAKRIIVDAALEGEIDEVLGEQSREVPFKQSYAIKVKVDVKSIIDGLNEVFSDTNLPEIEYSKIRTQTYATEILNNIVSFLCCCRIE